MRADEEQRNRIAEFKLENAATKEELTVRTACFKRKWRDHYYVEILRHSKGAGAKMQEWIERRAHYEKMFSNYEYEAEQQLISIAGSLIIG